MVDGREIELMVRTAVEGQVMGANTHTKPLVLKPLYMSTLIYLRPVK